MERAEFRLRQELPLEGLEHLDVAGDAFPQPDVLNGDAGSDAEHCSADLGEAKQFTLAAPPIRSPSPASWMGFAPARETCR